MTLRPLTLCVASITLPLALFGPPPAAADCPPSKTGIAIPGKGGDYENCKLSPTAITALPAKPSPTPRINFASSSIDATGIEGDFSNSSFAGALISATGIEGNFADTDFTGAFVRCTGNIADMSKAKGYSEAATRQCGGTRQDPIERCLVKCDPGVNSCSNSCLSLFETCMGKCPAGVNSCTKECLGI